MQDSNKPNVFLERRRQLLKMGAAGMPMMLTLRASAQEAVISQLRCVITMPKSFKILVDDTGAAWVGNRNIRKDKKGVFRPNSLNKFMDKAKFVFPEGSAPVAYRPDACETCDPDDGDDSGGDDSGGDDDSDFDLLSHLSDENGTYAMNDYLAGDGGYGGGDDSGGEDHGHGQCDEDDGHGHGQTSADCGYVCYEYSSGQSITPGDYISQGGGWTISGDEGLYLSLSLLYAEEYGNSGRWPGVSCIVSVLNYIGH